MKSKVITLAMGAFAASSAFGTVALNFNDEFNSGVPQNFANSAGVPTNGMIWGVLIDGSGNGLVKSNVGKYDAIPGGLAGGMSYVLSVAGVPTDDVFWTSTLGTFNTDGSTEGDFSTMGGVGGIGEVTSISFTNGVSFGDAFYVAWFDGAVGGTLADASFTVPADGSALAYGAPFVGVDAVRVAGLSYSGASGDPVGPAIAFVPEPSAALLGALGALGLLRRRRN